MIRLALLYLSLVCAVYAIASLVAIHRDVMRQVRERRTWDWQTRLADDNKIRDWYRARRWRRWLYEKLGAASLYGPL